MSQQRAVITVNLDIGGRRPSAEILDAAGIAWTHRFGGPDWLDEDTRAVVTDVDAILAALTTQLARFKVPRQLFVVDALPRNTMGKVQKNVLRDTYADTFAS